MTRTLSSITTAAIGQDSTTPVHLIRMAWETEQRICTWDQNITWDSETWTASGARIEGISASHSTLILPNDDDETWLDLVVGEKTLDRVVQIYEHHTSTGSPQGSDATLIFTGRMDRTSISETEIKIDLVVGRTNKGFPPTSIGPPTYNYLIPVGTRLIWPPDIIVVN